MDSDNESFGIEPTRAHGATAVTVIDVTANGSMPTAQVRSNSAFLAHLIATATRAPQTRALRRREPQIATSAYGATDRASTSPRLFRVA